MTKTYKELVVWQKSYKLSLLLYKASRQFPKDEVYALTSQMRRAAVSIPSNIAEGYCRQRKKEYLQFLQIAFGSGAELETQLLMAKDLGYISAKDFPSLNDLLLEVMKMLNSLIYKVKLSIKSSF
jgi:four helix bundle protein